MLVLIVKLFLFFYLCRPWHRLHWGCIAYTDVDRLGQDILLLLLTSSYIEKLLHTIYRQGYLWHLWGPKAHLDSLSVQFAQIVSDWNLTGMTTLSDRRNGTHAHTDTFLHASSAPPPTKTFCETTSGIKNRQIDAQVVNFALDELP